MRSGYSPSDLATIAAITFELRPPAALPWLWPRARFYVPGRRAFLPGCKRERARQPKA